ncbi:MAG: ATP-binding protein [Methylovirgula sp.]
MKLPKLSILPREIAAQIVLLVVLSAVIFHLCLSAAFLVGHLYFRPVHEFAYRDHAAWEAHRVAPDLNDGLVVATPRRAEPAMDGGSPPLDFADAGAPPDCGPGPPPSGDVPPGPPPPGGFRPGPPPPGGFRPGPPPPHFVPPPRDIVPMVLATVLFIAISFTIFLIWAVLAVTRPLRHFAEAVDAFSADGTGAPIEETGPREISAAAHALNRMRERVTLMIDQRTQMLAAIGHDLRTPVTRLRLRAEFVEPQELRMSILRDLEQMDAMIHSALSFIRDGLEVQRNTLLDLGALLQTIRDEFVDMGYNVLFETPSPTFIRGSADELYRALTNLVSNGLKFGTEVEIHLQHAEADHIQIDILDDGPGIPPESRAEMFAPFVRGDTARKSEPLQGFGLGLPISRAIVTAHRGSLELLDRSPHGVIARVTLAA